MYGSWLALKKSLLFSLPFFMSLPVFTESALILRSKTPVVTSVDGNTSVASHFSKLPSMATDALTANLTERASGVMTKTGPWARTAETPEKSKNKAIVRNLFMGPPLEREIFPHRHAPKWVRKANSLPGAMELLKPNR